jgi:hypothetical protein
MNAVMKRDLANRSSMESDFRSDVERNPANRAILSRWTQLDLPNAWLVAGCLFQTVWNLQAGRAPGAGIKDYDIFYFDPFDPGEASERAAQSRAESLLGDLGVAIEVSNQARVHLWYPKHFGLPYPALTSVEDGISRFLILETCVAVRPREQFAPNGTAGIYAGTLSPNPLTPYPSLFRVKAASYRERWDWLRPVE